MKRKIKIGILPLIIILVLQIALIVLLVTLYSQYHYANKAISKRIASQAAYIAEEVADAVWEYPAYPWLLRYWYLNADSMDIEYDSGYAAGTATEQKCRLLNEHHPDLQIKYIDVATAKALPPEDQKLFAEIIYSWLINDVDNIKENFNVNFLYCVVTDTDRGNHPYETQFFLFSGASPDTKRGLNYGDIYPLGKVVSVTDNQDLMKVMKEAVLRGQSVEDTDKETDQSLGQWAVAGDFVDYYSYLDRIDDKAVLIGMTHDLSGILKQVKSLTWAGTGYSMAYIIVMGLLIIIFIFLSVLRPLKVVVSNIRLYTQTKNSEEVKKNLSKNLEDLWSLGVRYNEIGELSQDVISLTEEIDDYTEKIEAITAEKERIGVELGLATRIQANMLPNVFPAFPDRTEFDLYASMTPAKEVGGDFYDFFLIDDDHLGIVMADVSGKGVPAALFMMAGMILIHNTSKTAGSPAEALALTNNAICSRNREEMFVTAWLGILQISTGKLTASNAGHEYPALKNADGSFELLKDKHGFVIGGMENIRYKDYEVQLQPGAKLFLYTDGVPEATNTAQEMYGTDRMINALRSKENGTPKDVLDAVNQSVHDFVQEAEQFDDLTMLCLEYKGKQEQE